MNLLTLLLLAAPVTRPLTDAELGVASPSLDCPPDPKQSFQTTALEPSPLWFVAARCSEMLTVALLKPGGEELQSLTLGRGVLDAVAFDDLDGDGSAEIILISGGELNVLSRQGDRYDDAAGIEARCARVLGAHPTIAKIRELYRPDPRPVPRLPKGVRSDCASGALPFAVSEDGRYGAWLGSTIDIHDFDSGQKPPWLSDRLQQVLDERLQPFCEETIRDGPHGTGLRCEEPVPDLQALVAGVQPPVQFVETLAALQQAPGSSPEATTVNRIGKPALEIPVRALVCHPHEFPHVLGVLYGPNTARIVYEPEDTGDHPLYQCTPEEQEQERQCYYSGGTCVHDVLCVPTAQPPPLVRMLTVPLR